MVVKKPLTDYFKDIKKYRKPGGKFGSTLLSMSRDEYSFPHETYERMVKSWNLPPSYKNSLLSFDYMYNVVKVLAKGNFLTKDNDAGKVKS